MNPDKKIKKTIRHFNITPSDRMLQNTLNDMLTAHDQNQPPSTPQPIVWRVIMQNKMTKYTAAACLIFAIILGTTFWGNSSDSPSAVLADMLKIMKQQTWIHYTFDITNTQTAELSDPGECWVSLNPMIQFIKEPDGSIIHVNSEENLIYFYDRRTNVLNISDLSLGELPLPQTPIDFVEKMIEELKTDGTDLTQEISEIEGRQVEVFQARLTSRISILYRDLETNLLIRTEDKILDRNGVITQHVVGYWDYPDQGPQNIYELDIPQDVIVHDNRPTGNELQLVDQVKKHFETGYGDYIAVICKSNFTPDTQTLIPLQMQIIRHQDIMTRSGTYLTLPPRPNNPSQTLYEDIADDWPDLSLEQVLALESDDALMSEVLFGGAQTINRFRFDADKELEITRQPYHPIIDNLNTTDNLPSLAWANFFSLTTLNKNVQYQTLTPDEKHQNLLGLQMEYTTTQSSGPGQEPTHTRHGKTFWFDPARDYLMIEHITYTPQDQAEKLITSIHTITDTAQTPDGKWYPTKIIRQKLYPDNTSIYHIYNILLKTNPAFIENVFTPDFKFIKK